MKNIRAAADYLLSRGFTIVSGGTDNHLFVTDMRSKGVDGGRIEAVMNEISIAINKNTVPVAVPWIFVSFGLSIEQTVLAFHNIVFVCTASAWASLTLSYD